MARRYRRSSSKSVNLESLLNAEKERMQFKSDFNSEYDRMAAEAKAKVEGLKKISIEEASRAVMEDANITVLNGLTVGKLVKNERTVSHVEYNEETSMVFITKGKCDLTSLKDSGDLEFYLA